MRYTIASRRTPTLLPRLATPGRARFPPRCPIEEHTESFIVMRATGQALGYFYFEDEPQRQMAMKRLSRDEAWRMAANFAKRPDLLRRSD